MVREYEPIEKDRNKFFTPDRSGSTNIGQLDPDELKNFIEQYFMKINQNKPSRFQIVEYLKKGHENKSSFKNVEESPQQDYDENHERDPKKILSPLERVFFDDELMDQLLVTCSVPELLEGKDPSYPGVILFGPPGTGKSVYQDALAEAYETKGAYVARISFEDINSPFVSGLPKSVERELKKAQLEGERRGIPSLITIDEASSLVEEGSGDSAASKVYKEAIDVLKRYIGNKCGDKLVLAISTNQAPEQFNQALVRESRLTPVHIGYPSPTQITKMWRHFLSDHDIIDIDEAQAQHLTDMNPEARGSSIEQFARTYKGNRKCDALKSLGHPNLLSALMSGEKVNEDEISRSTTLADIQMDYHQALLQAAKNRTAHLENNPNADPDRSPEMGFHTFAVNKN